MTYGNKYKILSRELHTSELWETYIKERDFTGSVTELIGTAIPVILEYRPENDNDYDIIRPSTCVVGMNSLTDMQFISFFTSDARKYKVLVYRSSVLLWAGWVVPDAYKEPYISASYEVFITATDGLLSLKDVTWEKTYAAEPIYTGKKTLMQGIESCLNKLLLPEIKVWDAAYIYEANHATTNTDSPLTQTYYNTLRFYDDDQKPLDCYTVLLEVLKSCNCQIWMQDGYWNMVPQNARKLSYVRRNFIWGGTGSYQLQQNPSAVETYDPQITINNIDYQFYATPELTFRPAWKKFKVEHDYSLELNLLKSVTPTFTANFFGGITDKGYVLCFNHQNLLADHGVNDYLEYDIGSILTNDNQSLKIEFKGNGYIIVAMIRVYVQSGATRYVVDGNGDWHTDFSGTATYNSSFGWEHAVIKTDKLPVSGTLKVRIDAPHTSARGDNYRSGYFLNDFKVSLVTSQLFYENKVVTTEINAENTYVPDTWEMMLADFPVSEVELVVATPGNRIRSVAIQDIVNREMIYKGGLFWLDGATYTPTSQWTVKGRNQYNRLINVIADEISVNHLDPQWIISGEIYGYFGYGNTLIEGSKKYMILRGSQNTYNKEWELEMFEIADTDQGYLKLRSGGYVKLRGGGKIKL